MNNFDQFIINNFPQLCQSMFSKKATPLSIVLDDLNTLSTDFYSRNKSEYKLYEEDNKIIFKCLAPCHEEKDLDIKIDNKTLEIKSNVEDKDSLDFKYIVDKTFKLKKDIDTEKSYAKLDKGMLTITMPVSEKSQKTLINFV